MTVEQYNQRQELLETHEKTQDVEDEYLKKLKITLKRLSEEESRRIKRALKRLKIETSLANKRTQGLTIAVSYTHLRAHET